MQPVDYEEGKKLVKTKVCAECSSALMGPAWGGAYKIQGYIIYCSKDMNHQGIMRLHKTSAYNMPGFNMPGVLRKKEKEMVQKYGEERAKAMVRAGGGNIIATLTQKGASDMLSILYPEAAKTRSGQAAIIKGSLICRDYGLNPAMDHLFIIGYKNSKTGEMEYSVVTGIKAKRLICGRDKSYGYIDDSPRIMTEDEQVRIFGEVDKSNVVTITKLKDKDGNIFPGYGKWPKDTEPKGINKGNSKFNMSCIRGESQALNKLNPGAMPADIDVVDERYIDDQPKVKVQEIPPEQLQQPEPELTEEQPENTGNNREMPEDTGNSPERPEVLVPGSDQWILSEMQRLGISETGILEYCAKYLNLTEETLADTLPLLTDDNRQSIIKAFNAKEKKVK